ncbi:unnamed protein product [Thlaspi arvense]|uniref:RRM domain-containing protein n=1 Tax=Thlaspi arvense TaxID=13288 RepID=A0AAU9STK7_THLAR|nr:unnamed protein product [Thlaspi arvense]
MSDSDNLQLQQSSTGAGVVDGHTAAATDVGWYILGENQENLGPYTFSELCDHFRNGFLQETTLAWAEGRSEWQPISAIPELTSTIYRAEVEGASGSLNGSNAGTKLQKQDKPASTSIEDELEKWQREIKEAEAEAERLKSGSVSSSFGTELVEDDQGRPSSPPDGEYEFTDAGTRYKWDKTLRVWAPQDDPPGGVDPYGLEEMTFATEDEVFPAINILDTSAEKEDELTGEKEEDGSDETAEINTNRKRKLPEQETEKKEANKPPESWFELKVNPHIYVTGLPTDVTLDEDDTGKHRIKLYTDKATGNLKGDALITYMKEPSVDLAIQLLDGAPLRLGDKLLMSVSRAKFEQKGERFITKQTDNKKKKKLKKVEQKLLGWGGRDDAKISIPATVVLRYMFSPAEMRSDESLCAEVEEDVKEESSKHGPFDSVKVCEHHPQGVVLVRFKDRKDAQKCVDAMHNRWYAKRQVHASIDDGSVNHAAVRDFDLEAERVSTSTLFNRGVGVLELRLVNSAFILAKKGPLGTIWIAAHLERKLRKNQVADTDIGVSVDSILFPEAPIALRLSSHLLLGVVRIYSRKVNYLFDDCSEALLKVKQAFRSAAVDLPPEESTAPYHSITLPETFDLDDFELPDNELFQGNYVDHHVSTREQITLQDTMDGVVYSTSQFGLDERFGDGDTSQAALELDEEVFQDKDAIGSEDEGVQGNDHNAYMDAATPEIKDETVTVSEAMPRDFNQEQVDDRAMRNELVEDAQAPQTPGLVEVPNSSSVREQLACDDHMEVEDLNAEEGRKASGELDANEVHKRDEDVSAEYNAEESAVTPMEVDKSLIDENANAENEQEEERAEHVHVTSPCCSHITTEMEDLGQVTTEAGTDVNNDVADKSDAVPPVESPGGPKDPGEENRDAIATEANQETDSSLQGDGQVFSRPDEQLNNAHETDEQLGDLTGFTESDLSAPEKVLAAPNRLGDENGFMVESTPDKEDPRTCNEDAETNNITGKKRTFTESTLTAESLNSIESVGLIQSKRTAESVPDDDDLLSSILVGKSSFLKMRPTPVLEVASTKRLRSAPRSTATKRKVLMDDPMVLHGDVIRQQLTNTEGIRRVRKKAPCTISEIPYDLRGIVIIENVDRHASVGVVEDNECSVKAVEENETEESSALQARPNDSEEQPAEAHTPPQEEGKDDNELGEKICDVEVAKEGDGAADEVNLLVNDEISQMPFEDKLDGVEDLQVEGCHENRDGGLGGEDVSADVNEKSCSDVIEIAEGDVDNNATLNETDLKVEDELPCEDKKTEASVEVSEIGIDDRTPCDNTVGSIESVEAGDFSNLALETCNEHLVEENNDGVNPEIESGNKDEPHNEMFDEEAYMQSAQDADPTSRDGLMGDNDEMDTMEVAHDTGFLNVDDDEVDEDHEDDGMQDGDETRLLENSGWSSRTRAVAKYLQTIFDKEAENGKNVVVADKLLAGKTRKEASRMFFETLVLKTRDYIQVEQAKPYESIIIKPRPRLTKSIF